MSRWIKPLPLSAVFLVLPCATGLLAAEPITPTPPVGTLIALKGDVKVGSSRVAPPHALRQGEVIRTGAESSCSILLGRDALLYLGEKTRLALTAVELEARKAELKLDQGKVRALLRSKAPAGRPRDIQNFSLRSRSATLGVRGTQFTLEVPEKPELPDRFVGIEGTVAVLLSGSEQVPVVGLSPREFTLGRGDVLEGGGSRPPETRMMNGDQLRQESRSCVPPPVLAITPAQLQAQNSLLPGVASSEGESGESETPTSIPGTGWRGGLEIESEFGLGEIPLDPISDRPEPGLDEAGAGRGSVEVEVESGKQD